MLIINSLGVFRVGVFTTLKTVKQLSINNLQVALRVSIEGSDRATRLPQRGLTALVLFFHWDSVTASDAPSGLYVLHVFAAATGWQNRLFCLRLWIHVCRSALFAPVVLH